MTQALFPCDMYTVVFICSNYVSPLYMLASQQKRGCTCTGSPHINPMEAVNHSCGWIGRNVRLGLWIRWLLKSYVSMLARLSMAMPSGRNDSREVEGEQVYLKRSLPAELSTTTARARMSATQISKFLLSLRYLMLPSLRIMKDLGLEF